MRDSDLLFLLALGEEDEPPPMRRIWVRETLASRNSIGEYATLLRETWNRPEEFYRSFRMSTERFDDLVDQVAPLIRRVDTNFRSAIPVAERLALTIR